MEECPQQAETEPGSGVPVHGQDEQDGGSDVESLSTRADGTPSVCETMTTGKSKAGPDGRKRPGRRKAAPEVVINVAECEYEVVRRCAVAKGWKLCENYFYFDKEGGSVCSDSTDSASLEGSNSRSCTHRGSCTRQANVIWHDHGSFNTVFPHLLPFQKVNHLPGLSDYARKIGMTSKLARMRRVYPKAFNFYPPTWILPNELSEFRREFAHAQPPGVFILKPDGGCQGRGITLTNNWAQVAALGDKRVVAQRYVRDPLLIEGLKCDLRLYVLVTSVDPLRIFLHKDGLVRLCTANYREPCPANLSNTFMHLTNYAIQKNSRAFDPSGTKRSLAWLFNWLRSPDCTVPAAAVMGEGGDVVERLWRDTSDVVVKTIIPVVPSLKMHYRWEAGVAKSRCFALLGFDLMLDSQLKPWLLEINHMPSLRTDTNVDREVKGRVVTDTLSLLFVSAGDRRRHLLKMWRKRRSSRGGMPQQGRDKAKKDQRTDPEEAEAEGGDRPSVGTGSSAVAGWSLTKDLGKEKAPSAPRTSEAKEEQGEAEEGGAQDGSCSLDSREEACKGGFERVYPSLAGSSITTREGYEAFLTLAHQLEHKHILRKPSVQQQQQQQAMADSTGQQQETKPGASKTPSLRLPASLRAARRSPTEGEGQEEEEEDVIEVEEGAEEVTDGSSDYSQAGDSSSPYRQLQALRRSHEAQFSRAERMEQQRFQRQSAVLERLEAKQRKVMASSPRGTAAALAHRRSQHQVVRLSYYPVWEMEGSPTSTASGTSSKSFRPSQFAMQRAAAARHFHRSLHQHQQLHMPTLPLLSLCDIDDADDDDDEGEAQEDDGHGCVETAHAQQPIVEGDDEEEEGEEEEQQHPRAWGLLPPSSSSFRLPVPPTNSVGRRLWASGWARTLPGMTGHLSQSLTLPLGKETELAASCATASSLRRYTRGALSTVNETAAEQADVSGGTHRLARRDDDALASPLPSRKRQPQLSLESRTQRFRAAMAEASGSGDRALLGGLTMPAVPAGPRLPRGPAAKGTTGGGGGEDKSRQQSLLGRRRTSRQGSGHSVVEGGTDGSGEASVWVPRQPSSTTHSRRAS